MPAESHSEYAHENPFASISNGFAFVILVGGGLTVAFFLTCCLQLYTGQSEEKGEKDDKSTSRGRATTAGSQLTFMSNPEEGVDRKVLLGAVRDFLLYHDPTVTPDDQTLYQLLSDATDGKFDVSARKVESEDYDQLNTLLLDLYGADLGDISRHIPLARKKTARSRATRADTLASGKNASKNTKIQMPSRSLDGIINGVEPTYHQGASLSEHPGVPKYARWFIPFLFIINLGLFTTGNLSSGAAVDIIVNALGQDATLDNFKTFSVVSTVIDLWWAEAYLLAALIGALSLVWPYIKVVLMVYCWFSRPKTLGVKNRDNLLSYLDMAGKFALVEVYFLMLVIVMFRISVPSPSYDVLPDNLYRADIIVLPELGLFVFCTASALSLLINNLLVVWAHNLKESQRRVVHHLVRENTQRNVLGKNGGNGGQTTTTRHVLAFNNQQPSPMAPSSAMSQNNNNNNDILIEYSPALRLKGARALPGTPMLRLTPKELPHLEARVSLRNHAYELVATREFKIVITTFGEILIIALLLVATAFTVMGLYMGSLELSITGVLRNVMEMAKTNGTEDEYQQFADPDKTLSILGVIPEVMSTATPQNSAGIVFLLALYTGTMLVFPLGQVISMINIWFQNYTLAELKRRAIRQEIISAWCGIEVFIAGIVLAILEIGQISENLLNEQCISLLPVLEFLTNFGFVPYDEERLQCFRLRPSMLWGAFYLVGGTVLLNIILQIMIHLMHKVIDEVDHAHLQAALDDVEERLDNGPLDAPVLRNRRGVPNYALSYVVLALRTLGFAKVVDDHGVEVDVINKNGKSVVVRPIVSTRNSHNPIFGKDNKQPHHPMINVREATEDELVARSSTSSASVSSSGSDGHGSESAVPAAGGAGAGVVETLSAFAGPPGAPLSDDEFSPIVSPYSAREGGLTTNARGVSSLDLDTDGNDTDQVESDNLDVDV
jgi:hypothetical protein